MQEKISRLESRLNEIATEPATVAERADRQMQIPPKKSGRQRTPLPPDRDVLVSAGVSPEAADDILRRIGRQEFRSLELRNLMQRSAPADRQRYAAELRELRQKKVTLRSELGDDAYDRYLFASGQDNRVKASSVMAGSPAEINGIHKDDVVLYYGDRKILTASDLSKATLEGDIGSYINVEVLRDGARMSLLLPRGTLGVQLEAVRLDPDR
ncbi:MAG TPA: PDZ domain-containing protein [Gammaproteobacteria bacterium]|nr:PDZ domain-containing protein [Gammaproteobacteria bacterium]